MRMLIQSSVRCPESCVCHFNQKGLWTTHLNHFSTNLIPKYYHNIPNTFLRVFRHGTHNVYSKHGKISTTKQVQVKKCQSIKVVQSRRLTMGGRRGVEMCSLGQNKEVMDSPAANIGTYFLAPNFSSNDNKFNIEVGLEEEELDLEPRDCEARYMVKRKMKKGREFLDFWRKESKEVKRCESEESKKIYA